MPLILVTNDDGVSASGIEALASAAAELGDVLVCAPAQERSGSSHAITFHTHLRAREVRPKWWSVSGTPVDCVYIAIHHLCGQRPDLVLSGVNNGYNLGTDVFYSGTVGAAAEARLKGIPALAVSADRGVNPYLAKPATVRVGRALLGAASPILVNMNLPEVGGPPMSDDEAIETGETLALEVSRLGPRRYRDAVHARDDPQGNPYFWIGGPPTRADDVPGDDTYVVANGAIAVTPLELDVTAPSLDPLRALLDLDPKETSR